MKNIFYGVSILLILFTLFSCEKDEQYDYAGGNQVYFATTADSSTYSFAIKSSSVHEDVALIPVAVSGIAAGIDREIKIEVVAEGTTAREGVDFASGGHFRLEKTILRKGEIETHIPVTVFRQKSIAGSEVVVWLRIVPDENFLGDMGEDFLIHKFKINDILTKPDNWDTYIRRYFGEYGPVKYQFIIDHLGRYDFRETGDDPVAKAEMAYFKDKLKTYLMEYEKENGPLYEEGNVRVTF